LLKVSQIDIKLLKLTKAVITTFLLVYFFHRTKYNQEEKEAEVVYDRLDDGESLNQYYIAAEKEKNRRVCVYDKFEFFEL
jgi:hypothetical protein